MQQHNGQYRQNASPQPPRLSSSMVHSSTQQIYYFSLLDIPLNKSSTTTCEWKASAPILQKNNDLTVPPLRAHIGFMKLERCILCRLLCIKIIRKNVALYFGMHHPLPQLNCCQINFFKTSLAVLILKQVLMQSILEYF